MENQFTFRKFDFRSDLLDLFKCMTDPYDQVYFHGKININSVADFEKFIISCMANVYHDFYVIEDKSTYSTVGYIYSYEFRLLDGNCKICAFFKKEYRNSGVGAICTTKFIKELFDLYPLRKIYIDVYEFNRQSLESNLKAGFVEEGLLKGYRYYKNEYHDTHILALTRENFFTFCAEIIKRV